MKNLNHITDQAIVPPVNASLPNDCNTVLPLDGVEIDLKSHLLSLPSQMNDTSDTHTINNLSTHLVPPLLPSPQSLLIHGLPHDLVGVGFPKSLHVIPHLHGWMLGRYLTKACRLNYL